MTNPLRLPKYDRAEFLRWNFGVRRSIQAYDQIKKDYPEELHQMKPIRPVAKYSPISNTKICAEIGCNTPLVHLRSLLCESHREARYLATKRGRSA